MDTDQATNQTHRRSRWPAWLDGRTIALLSTMIALGALMQTSHMRLANDLNQVRVDLRGEIATRRDELKSEIGVLRDRVTSEVAGLDDRLRAVEIDVAAIRAALPGLDSRPHPAVEDHARHPPPG